jgi:hypothetical protein
LPAAGLCLEQFCIGLLPVGSADRLDLRHPPPHARFIHLRVFRGVRLPRREASRWSVTTSSRRSDARVSWATHATSRCSKFTTRISRGRIAASSTRASPGLFAARIPDGLDSARTWEWTALADGSSATMGTSGTDVRNRLEMAFP